MTVISLRSMDMRTIFIWGCLLTALIEPCMSNLCLHFPPGSNNRLNTADEIFHDQYRLFNSENHGKSGYNVGDNGESDPGAGSIPEYRQLPMEFYMSGCDEERHKTEIEIMWTNQHGAGRMTDDMVESQVILQYMCQPYPQGKMTTDNVETEFEYHTIRNGQQISIQSHKDTDREDQHVSKSSGLHEPYNYFRAYCLRERNKGLFTADQNLGAQTSLYTRQNPNGHRYGFEVPEERDYFPYWGPTPWKDIAILVSNETTKDLMTEYVTSPQYGHKYMCVRPNNLGGVPCPPTNGQGNPAFLCITEHITEDSCENAGGTWTKFITNFLEKTSGVLSTCHDVGEMKLARGVPYEAHKISQGADNKLQYVLLHKTPEVIYAPSTVVNHLGMSIEGKFSTYKWKVPCFPSNTTQRCVLRLRYNITTDDVPREFNAGNNNDITANPVAKAVDNVTDLQLALNTHQVGRTFQDRSHVFILKPRNQLPLRFQHSNIYYIGGMGKRGDIVQTYPAMEYRFTPERIAVTTKDVLCFVWSGSNNNPGHYSGHGAQSTDRTNVCWVKEGCSYLKPHTCFSLPLEVVDHVDKFDAHKLNLHLNTGCYKGQLQQSPLQSHLDNSPASCNPPCFRITRPGEYCYMSTRNNYFSHRRHIGKITVTQAAE